jgi:L-galactose dehydrogenase
VINEAIPALKKLRDQGKLKYIGISGLPLYIYKYVLDHTNDIDVVLSYCHSTLLDDSLLVRVTLVSWFGTCHDSLSRYG